MIQCFVKKEYEAPFGLARPPRLFSVSRTDEKASAHPRVMHAHDDLVEIVLVRGGESRYYVGGTPYDARRGDLFIFNSRVVHDEPSGPEQPVATSSLALGGLSVPGLRENALLPDDAGYVFSTGAEFGDIRSICSMMFRNLSSGEPDADAFCNSLMHALLVKVLTLAKGRTVEPTPDDEPHALGHLVKEYIDQHYMEPITLQSMGEALHISPYYLSHVFKQMSGYSPVQYLLRRRIGEAQTLLITTDLPITRIAEMVGYDTQSYFNLQFTKNVGMPPNKFRQNYIVAEKDKSDGKKGRRKKKET